MFKQPREKYRVNLYINHETKERECGTCREILDWSKFSLNNYKVPKPDCKKCRSEREAARQVEKLLSLKPHRYRYCEDEECMKIYNISRKNCPKCGVKNER